MGLATVAALTPPDWEVEIVDEYIESVPEETDADIVGITGTNVEYRRQIELLERFRGSHTVAGGPYVSLVPSLYWGKADTLICGEAEYIWPRFCADWPNVEGLYRETGTVDMRDVPPSRYDLVKLDRYLYAGVQFSRGCPYRCEFCDAIVIFGRKPRTKAPEQVREELECLEGRNVFFVDDNFIGHKAAAKALLRAIKPGNGVFGAEASLNLAQDPELMALMRERRFEWVFSGIESPDLATLRNTGKHQNTREDPLDSVRRLYANGIQIYGGFIVGFDEDGPEVFERQYRFIMESGIQMAQISQLFAMPGTPLYKRLKAEGRVLGGVDGMDQTRDTNIVPKRMTRGQLIEGHARLCLRLYETTAIAERIARKMAFLKDPVTAGGADLAAIAKLRGFLPARPASVVEMKDWALGLNLRDYVERNFGIDGPREVHL